MNSIFLQKQIRQVAKTYTEQDIGLPLTEKEEQRLIFKIKTQLQTSSSDHLREIVHDVVYSYFTNQDDD